MLANYMKVTLTKALDTEMVSIEIRGAIMSWRILNFRTINLTDDSLSTLFST